MTYGWGRWEDAMSHAQLRKGWTHTDIEVSLGIISSYSARQTVINTSDTS